MSEHKLDAALDLIPAKPGVYLMKDASGSVIYVGKAKVLPNRLRSYFTEHPQGNKKVLAMISHIADFDYIVCANELEALILENNLIKKYQPHYNILLRDDKEYPYIRVTLNEEYPRVMRAFHVGDDRAEGARYYGPYLAGDLYRALKILRKIFPIKTCRRVLPRDIGKERPCLKYYIGRCIGPCKGDVSAADYRAVIDKICRFLDGQYNELLGEMRERMETASANLEFEKAALWRDRYQALEKLMERQVIVTRQAETFDALAVHRNGSEICLQNLEVREGRMTGSSSRFLADNGESELEILTAYLQQHYVAEDRIPPLILLSDEIEDADLIARWLAERAGRKVELRVPQRGEKMRVMEMAEANATDALRRHTLIGGSATGLEQTLKILADEVQLDHLPHRIEAYDVANLGAKDQTAAMVVFYQGKPKRQAYRHFGIKPEGEEKVDDYRAMRQIISRRLARLGEERFGERPDLILVDGGLGHVRAVLPLIQDADPPIALAGMVKDNRHRTRGLVMPDGSVLELRQIPEDETPDERAERMGMLRLLTAIQDEAHRFAGRLLKKQRSKKAVRYSLEDIPGVGPARRRELMKHFRTIKNVSEASLDELKQVSAIPEDVAIAIHSHFHGDETR